jgi:serine/threonine-protein kinase
MATLTGKTLGKYQVLERIGRGGMADVYKGRHARLDRLVAIKVLHSHLAEGEDFLARFEREARAVACLKHPNIVQVYDFDVENDTVYMVMEYIAGGNLRLQLEQAFQAKRYLGLTSIQQILHQVGRGLDHAHAQGMLHRDVKPANILLREDGQTVLADFGIARIVSSTHFTATGSLIGTPAYMSPEQGRGETLTPASDLYALGVILYEMLTNRVPFDAETPLAIIHKQIHDPLPGLADLRDDLPPAIVRVVKQALAKVPEERFQSGMDFSDAFQVGMVSPGREEEEKREELATTMVMEERQESGAGGPTVVMEENGMPVETTVTEEPPGRDGKEDRGTEERPVPGRMQAGGMPRTGKHTASSARSGRRFLPGILIAVVVIVLIVAGVVGGWFSSAAPACSEIGQCIQFSEDALQAGDPEEAVSLLEMAIERVPAGEQPPYAELWCRRGEALVALERIETAIGSFVVCAEWTHDEPALVGLREDAIRRAQELGGE